MEDRSNSDDALLLLGRSSFLLLAFVGSIEFNPFQKRSSPKPQQLEKKPRRIRRMVCPRESRPRSSAFSTSTGWNAMDAITPYRGRNGKRGSGK